MNILILLFLSWATVVKAGLDDLPCIINNKFNTNLLKARFDESPDKSLIVSAYSLLTPLSQLLLAATGQTERELLDVIGVTTKDVVRDSVPETHNRVCVAGGITMKEASKIYIQEGYQLKKSFIRETKKLFGSQIEEIDFKYVAANAAINAWVEGQTDHKIENLLSTRVPLDALILLVNAVYFKASWAEPFQISETQPKTFHVSKSHTAVLPFMHQRRLHMYTESKDLDAKLIRIAYKDLGAEFLAVVPNDIEGLKDLMNKIDLNSIAKAKNETIITEVTLSIPKFKIETETNLKNTLRTLGLHTLFEKAELTDLVEDAPLVVSQAIQKAYISVYEEGTEGAAANNIILAPTSTMLPPPMATLDIDRPFYFEVTVGSIKVFSGVFQNS